jgi:hypothetical protein
MPAPYFNTLANFANLADLVAACVTLLAAATAAACLAALVDACMAAFCAAPAAAARTTKGLG